MKPLDFGHALRAMKRGERVFRKGWNGRGMWLELRHFSKRSGLEPCIVIRTTQGKMQPGWVPSQADILATDWRGGES